MNTNISPVQNSTSRQQLFVNNWVQGAHECRSLRRRLMAVLRKAYRVLGFGRRYLGLGSLGSCSNGVVVAAAAALLTTGTALAGSGTDGGVTTGKSSTAISDSSGFWGCGSGVKEAKASEAYAIAIGCNSSASVEGGIALGSNSVANRIAGTRGYDPSGSLSDTEKDSYVWKSTLGALSIGDVSEGKTRQITGVAAGTYDTDAVNVAQLRAGLESVDSGSWYLSAGGENETEAGKGGRVNLKNTDENISVTKGEGDNNVSFDLADSIKVANITAKNTITVGSPTGDQTVINEGVITSKELNITGATKLGDVFSVEDNVATYSGSIETETSIVNKKYVDGGIGELANKKLTFESDTGTISRKLGEAVSIIGGKNLETAIDDGKIMLSMIDNPAFGEITINNGGRISGLVDGTDDQDAVTLSQLKEVSNNVNAGWGLTVNGGENKSTVNPKETVDLKNTDGNINLSKRSSSNDVIFNLADDIKVEKSLTVGKNKEKYAELTGDGLKISGGPSITRKGINAGEQKITYVGAGSIDKDSTDAINGSQLWGMGDSIATYLGGGAKMKNGRLTAPSYKVVSIDGKGKVTYGEVNNVGGALGQLSDSVENVNSRVGKLGGDISGLQQDALKWDDNKKAYDATRGEGASKITGVAAGDISEKSTDAVNGSQLHDTNQRVDGLEERVGGLDSRVNGLDSRVDGLDDRVGDLENGIGDLSDRAVTYDGPADEGYDTITLKGGKGTQITNLKDGEISETSKDAVNGSQLHATNQAVSELDQSSVKYKLDGDGNKTNAISLVGGDPNAPVMISNVAAGTAETDAANVGQVKESAKATLGEAKGYTDNRVTWAIDQANTYTDQVSVTTLNRANSYTDYKFGQLNQEIGDVRTEARQAAAIGLAAASLRYDDRPGKLSVAVGGGYWRSEGALAFGAGYTNEDGRIRANLSGTTAGGHWGVGAGVSFTLN